MKLVTSSGSLNFAEILPKIEVAQSVFISTCNLDFTERSPLLAALRKMPAKSRATIVTNVPNRKLARPGNARAGTDVDVERYIKLLDPAKFTCALEPWFCFDNHAKIVVCDNLAYVGSANLTWGSQRNFEAGYLINAAADLIKLKQFANEMITSAVPYQNVQGYREQQILLQFAAELPAIIETIEQECCEWEQDYSGHGAYAVRAVQLAIPAPIVDAIRTAAEASRRLQESADECEVTGEVAALVTKTENCLSDLRDLVEEIEAGEVLPEKIFQEDLEQELVQKHLNALSSCGNVAEVQSHSIYQDELTDILGKNDRERAKAADRCYRDLMRLLVRSQPAISALLREVKVNEKLKKIEMKFKG